MTPEELIFSQLDSLDDNALTEEQKTAKAGLKIRLTAVARAYNDRVQELFTDYAETDGWYGLTGDYHHDSEVLYSSAAHEADRALEDVQNDVEQFMQQVQSSIFGL